MRDDRTGAYRAVIADGDTRQDSHITADPHIITNSHGLSPFLAGLSFTRVGTMARAVDIFYKLFFC